MESTIVLRANQVCEYYQVSGSTLAKKLGVSQQMISRYLQGKSKPSVDFLEKFASTFPDVSMDWFFRGKGKMMNDAADINTPYDVESVEYKPVAPAYLLREPNVDVKEYVTSNDVQMTPVVSQFPSYDMLIPIHINAITHILRKTNVNQAALQSIPIDSMIDGRLYAIDTKGVGILIGRIYNRDTVVEYIDILGDGEAPLTIKKEDVYHVYRIVGILSVL